MSRKYEGDVVFVDGVHYAVKDGQPNLDRPLRWDAESAGYRSAEKDDALHNDTHHLADLDLSPGSEG